MAAHGWSAGKIVTNETAGGMGGQFRYVPRCECGWSGPDCLSDGYAAELALAHVRQAEGRSTATAAPIVSIRRGRR